MRAIRVALLGVCLMVGTALAPVPTAVSAADSLEIPQQPDPAGDGFHIRPEEGQVFRLYVAVFGRAPDDGGAAFWANQLVRSPGGEGRSLTDIADFFITSDEFTDRFGAPGEGDFVELLYRNVLGRAPDSGGQAFWLNELASGRSRRSVVLGFSESPEFAAATNTAPPERAPFDATVTNGITAAELGETWQPGCPVGPDELVRLTVATIDFGGRTASGEIIVHEDAAAATIRVFEAMYNAGIPVENMTPAHEFGGDDLVIMAANATTGFNCRVVTGGASWSRHAFGRALDINPLYNPYVRGSVVLPIEGAEWVDRDRYHPAMLFAGDPVVATARAEGWRWGGDFRTLKDYQHFDR